jgi:hypothetical protein
VAQTEFADTKEAFELFRPVGDFERRSLPNPMQGHNQWPTEERVVSTTNTNTTNTTNSSGSSGGGGRDSGGSHGDGSGNGSGDFFDFPAELRFRETLLEYFEQVRAAMLLLLLLHQAARWVRSRDSVHLSMRVLLLSLSHWGADV